MLVVGRQRGAPLIRAVARQFAVRDLRVWALDGDLEGLEESTVGGGPGLKFDLLNRLLQLRPVPSDHWVAVVDDDVVLTRGSGQDLIRVGDRSGFDLFQPAHSLASIRSHDFVVARPFVRADLVSFVEIGPLFVISPEGRDRFLPFPDDIGMGYGLELEWWRLARHGARLGLVSECRMVHCSPVAQTYSSAEEETRLALALAEEGFDRVQQLHVILLTWWRWLSRPPWAAGAP